MSLLSGTRVEEQGARRIALACLNDWPNATDVVRCVRDGWLESADVSIRERPGRSEASATLTFRAPLALSPLSCVTIDIVERGRWYLEKVTREDGP